MEQHTEAVKKEATITPITLVVKYGYLGFIGEFEYRGTRVLVPNQGILVETERGIELGRFLCYSCDMERGLKVCPGQLNRFLDASGPEYLKRKAGKVIRPADPQDLIEEHHIHADAGAKKRYCLELAERYHLKMKVVCVEHLFGGERIIFYFASEGRIDFREMVRELAKEYQTRIELRQIGARDEARLLADYEICGRECCCKNFLKTLHPVNMKMAKLQKATLDPSKVSGRCGRLRCCLRYEQKTYEDLVSSLPAIGSWVQTPNGVGRVKDRMVLTQLVQVAYEDNRLISYPVAEISPSPPAGQDRAEPEKEQMDSRMDTREYRDDIPLSPKADDDDGIPVKDAENKPTSAQTPQGGQRPRRNRGKKRRR
ncbi:MAG: regulatory iron-sulfur-containing complex subunit RicT [Phycisphaerae bacterium]